MANGSLSSARVYVRSNSTRFHTDPACPHSEQPHEGMMNSWCPATAAHRSCLQPCSRCGAELARELSLVLGRIPSGERTRLPLPQLHAHHGYAFDGADREPGTAAGGAGLAQGPGEPRLTTRGGSEWGVANYRQDVEEFLGESTNDDHDWRGHDPLD